MKHLQTHWLRLLVMALIALAIQPGMATASSLAQEETPPPADVVNDEGGPVAITGNVVYTNPFFTLGVAAPVIILEDQAGFVDRNEYFLMPIQSQTLGQITSDFYTSPFSYSITLPIEPQGSYRDVDFDEEEEQGVQVYAIAYWNNTFGDPYLEERDLYGGGWSTAYASTEISEDPETEREIVGGSFLVYAPDDEQGFPSGFGEDGLLFTEDDPVVTLPQGYTLVDMDTDPFTFDRSRNPVVDLIEPDGAALVDLSGESYADAFTELVDILSKEYAFTEYKDIDWDALLETYLPGMEEADETGDVALYRRTLRDFVWEIPDGHLFGSAPIDINDFVAATAGGLGMSIRALDDDSVIVNFILPGGPAEEAGIELGTEIVAIDGTPILDRVDEAVAWAAPFSTDHVEQLQKLRYAIRFPLGTEVDVTFLDDEGAEVTVPMEVVDERTSFNFSSFSRDVTGFELPVQYRTLPSGYVVVEITSFSDNSLLTIQLWERLMRTLNEQQVPGIIIDMRNNGGGRGFLADQMAAYFFDEPLTLGNTALYDEERGEFYIDSRGEERFYLPSDDLRYRGDVVVLVGPSCASACEFFSYDMTLENRAVTMGHYPTAGLGGSVNQLLMPEQERFRYTVGRALDPDGNIHIEGIGVGPDIKVPVTAEALLSGEDVVLQAAVDYLDGAGISTQDGGDIAIGESVEGTLSANVRVRYTLDVTQGDVINISVESSDFDAFVALYSVTDELLTYADDIDSDNLNALIAELEIPVDLTIVVEVSSASDLEEGSYTLSIEDATMAAEEGEGEGEGEGEESDEPEASEDAEGATILETAAEAGDFQILLAALDVADLTEFLSGDGPFTVFAPTDAAFEALNQDVLADLLEDPEALAEVLTFHVARGALLSGEIVGMDMIGVLNNSELNVTMGDDGSLFINDALVIAPDIEASNGVIHVIDAVLVPEE